jgi:hypothetical protein
MKYAEPNNLHRNSGMWGTQICGQDRSVDSSFGVPGGFQPSLRDSSSYAASVR